MKNILRKIENNIKKQVLMPLNSHNWDHTERVVKLALHIARKEKADAFIVKIAALLHDIGRRKEDKTNGKIDHAKYGAKLARKILKKYKLKTEIIDKIAHCIEAHRFRGNIKPETKEAKCLYDADKLDSIGAVGIGRAFLFAGEVGAKLHNKDIDIKKTKPYTKEDTAYREYMVKLRYIKSKMLTNEGRRIAISRDAIMRDFFIRFIKEIKGVI
ncbi:MAG: HD domain-containing protein [Candidatus Goldbacteria bacterium]|nr:HD domain-containing protein [Candidatus Goldiibacteriota bacterium]